MDENTPLTRRRTLLGFAGLVAGAAGAGAWKLDAADAAGGPAAVASGLVTCVLTPELTQGPYYIPNERVRRNITEGKPGVPLTLRTTVLDASSCKPIRNAAVDIWHADASGVYSGFGVGASSRTFLRGVQRTDAKGVAAFQTIYPGWYQGRAVHIHVMVHVAGTVVHTGQFFFPESLTDVVYKRSPYSARPNRDVRNADDSIFRNGGDKGLLHLKKSGTGYVGTIAMGVHSG
jgi:protocatechuate 3,4-dioxygenase beta subunit